MKYKAALRTFGYSMCSFSTGINEFRSVDWDRRHHFRIPLSSQSVV